MATVITPVRIVKVQRQSVQNARETVLVDFDLSADQGVRIWQVRFDVFQGVLVPGGDNDRGMGSLALHVEQGTLELDIGDTPTDRLITNSEVIAEVGLEVPGSNTVGQQPDTGFHFTGDPVTDFSAMGGMDMAISPQFSVTSSDANFALNGAMATIFYQYLKLSQAELASQFLSRR